MPVRIPLWIATAYLALVWDTAIASGATAAPSATALWVMRLACRSRQSVIGAGLIGMLLDAGQRGMIGPTILTGLLVAGGIGIGTRRRPSEAPLLGMLLGLATVCWLILPPLIEATIQQTAWEMRQLSRPLLSSLLTLPLVIMTSGSTPPSSDRVVGAG